MPRLFRVTVPALPVFFSGTGDMFAALLVARLREAAKVDHVLDQASWKSADHVAGHELPLARATEKVLASMGAVLQDTARHYEQVAKSLEDPELQEGEGEAGEKARDTERHLRLTRAAEVRVVRNTKALREPPSLEEFNALAVELEDGTNEYGEAADELGVVKVAGGHGATHQT
jgi:pyridoxine kinase